MRLANIGGGSVHICVCLPTRVHLARARVCAASIRGTRARLLSFVQRCSVLAQARLHKSGSRAANIYVCIQGQRVVFFCLPVDNSGAVQSSPLRS